tara:strand:+ start:277 stop:393 length:117 start_codon:yes stop_codon:yes gene_type:complete
VLDEIQSTHGSEHDLGTIFTKKTRKKKDKKELEDVTGN